MIPIYSEDNHYQNWAIYFSGEAYALHCEASLHVEDFEDAVFWECIFNQYSGGKQFNYIWYSSTPKGIDTTGVNHCLKFKSFLNKQFFLCIDSDYRYLMQEPDINPENFIFQTYTYSFENHLCYSGDLNNVCKTPTGIPNLFFDFKKFILSYSFAVYEVLIWHLFFVKNDESKFLKSEFTQLINLQQSVDYYDVNNNGMAVLEVLINRCKQKQRDCILNNPDVNIEKEMEFYSILGLHPENAYLYVRGHNLYDLICSIGNSVDENILKQEKQNLKGNNLAIKKLYSRKVTFEIALLRHIMFDQYPEIRKLGTEIHNLFG